MMADDRATMVRFDVLGRTRTATLCEGRFFKILFSLLPAERHWRGKAIAHSVEVRALAPDASAWKDAVVCVCAANRRFILVIVDGALEHVVGLIKASPAGISWSA